MKEVPKEKLKEVKKLITPKVITDIYNALCSQCKVKALYNRKDFCDTCQKKVEGILNDKYNN